MGFHLIRNSPLLLRPSLAMASVQFTEDDKKIIDEHPVESPFLDGMFTVITSKANAQVAFLIPSLARSQRKRSSLRTRQRPWLRGFATLPMCVLDGSNARMDTRWMNS